ncbi:hypothetical protein CERSUDRAFT_116874 [Gelatoporia subvermispora B]|uniref:Oxidized purine nucleoside triphosphate hydrolase n=1 Tax=Ceriporiopsis subvermispora (strain B) TaxID=914234 RepID=M2R7L8_CERS8|nr:hypothetical protein CERSUDRAFT_116874 [Gelatoporia subvermispora B]
MTQSIPPGLQESSDVIETASGGTSQEWMPFEQVKLYTNAFVLQDNKILLGYKKRGLGKDLYNGFGGKVEPGETSAEAAVRELQEEAGITATLRHCGVLFFTVTDIPYAFHVDVYIASEYSGTIIETEEMRPQWFSATQSTSEMDVTPEFLPIPYETMWTDDPFWLPLLIQGRPFVGRVDFGSDNCMQKWWFAEIPSSPDA